MTVIGAKFVSAGEPTTRQPLMSDVPQLLFAPAIVGCPAELTMIPCPIRSPEIVPAELGAAATLHARTATTPASTAARQSAAERNRFNENKLIATPPARCRL